MHPAERSILETIANFNYRSIPPEDQAGKDYTLNLTLAHPLHSGIFACRMLDTLRRYKVLEGEAKPVRVSQLKNMQESLDLGPNAKLLRSADDPETVVLSMTFHNQTPEETHRKLNKIIERLKQIDRNPSGFDRAEQAAASTFRAAGIPISGVKSTHEDITVHLASADVPHDRLNNILQAMLNAGLFQLDDVRSSPTYITHEDGSLSWHLPYPDKSLREVLAGFFKTEIDIRQRAEDMSQTPWREKVTSSTFVSGEGLGRQ